MIRQKAALFVIGIVASLGCSLMPRYTGDNLRERVERSTILIEKRHIEADGKTETEKALCFLNRIESELVGGNGAVRPSTGEWYDVETTAAYLGAISWLICEKDDLGGIFDFEDIASRTVDAIRGFDLADGSLDGCLVKTIDASGNPVKKSSHGNVYDQVLWGYWMAVRAIDSTTGEWDDSGDVRARILAHIEIILNNYISTGCIEDSSGTVQEMTCLFEDGFFGFKPTDALSLVAFCELAMEYGSDDLRRLAGKILSEHRLQTWQIGHLSMSTRYFYWPSHGSVWLSYLAAHMLCHLNSKYTDDFLAAHIDNMQEMNPFWNLAIDDAATVLVSESEIFRDVSFAHQILGEWPIFITEDEILNSPDRGLYVRWPPRLVKFEFERESNRPLPVWRRPIRDMMWKRNQWRIDGNYGKYEMPLLSGIDYLTLYAMTRYLERN